MLARASYGLPCGYPWVATQDASDRLLLPYHSTPSTRVSSTSVVVARLSPDAPTEDRAFHDAVVRFGGPFFLCCCGAKERSLLPWCPKGRTSDTPVASLAVPVALSHARAVQGPPRSFLPAPREGERLSRPEVPSIVGYPRPCARPRFRDWNTRRWRSPARGFAAAVRFSTSVRAQLPPPVREAFPAC